MTIILVIGLMPSLNLQKAYADDGDATANEDTPAAVEGDEAGDAALAPDDIGDADQDAVQDADNDAAPDADNGAVQEDAVADAASDADTPALLSGRSDDFCDLTLVTSSDNPFVIQGANGSDGVDTWDGESESSPIKVHDDATDTDTYYITSAAELKAFREMVTHYNSAGAQGTSFTSANAVLMTDIDWGSHAWEPIAASGGYTGTFDGNGHTITFHEQDTVAGDWGFFDQVGAATIKNLTIGGSLTIEDSGDDVYVGAIAARSTGAACIDNCVNKMDIEVTDPHEKKGTAAIGGILGQSLNSTATVVNCGNEGSVYFHDSAMSYSYVGGIVAYSGTAIHIANCYDWGDITGEGSIGGILGDANSGNTYVCNCYSVGNVAGADTTAYSIVGYFSPFNSYYFQDCHWPSDSTAKAWDDPDGYITFVYSDGSSSYEDVTTLTSLLNNSNYKIPDTDLNYLTWVSDDTADGRPHFAEYETVPSVKATSVTIMGLRDGSSTSYTVTYSLDKLQEFAPDGYTIVGLSETEGDDDICADGTVTFTGGSYTNTLDKTLYPILESTPFPIDISDIEHGTITATVDDKEVTEASEGVTVTLTVTPDDGHAGRRLRAR